MVQWNDRLVYIDRLKEGDQTGPCGWKGHRTCSKLRGTVDMKYDNQEPKLALLKIKSIAGKWKSQKNNYGGTKQEMIQLKSSL